MAFEGKSQRVEGGMGTSDGDWKTVNNRRYGRNDNGSDGFSRQKYYNGEGSSRGGFNGRGKGGLGGRGFGDQRFYKSENVQFVPVNKKNEVVNDSGVGRGNKNNGKNKMDIDTNDSSTSRVNGMDSRNLVSGKKVNKKNVNKKDGINVDNRFTTLSEEEIVKRSDISELKLGIDNFERQIAHSYNVVAAESRVKAKAMVKSVMIEHGLIKNQAFRRVYDQVFRDELERIKDMIISKLIAKAKLFFKTEHVFTKHELDTWLEEKIDFYKLSISDFAYEKIIQQIRVGNNANMDEEGAGIKDFRDCIDSLELEDINMTWLFYTWLQKMRNPELGVLKKLDRIMGNAHFLNEYPNSFAVFMPYLTSDQPPTILTIPDLADIAVKGYEMFKLAKKLKNMKKHMIQMNRSNGNVFEKVKVLKDELSKIQLSLEEEMVFYNAYREATLDEEKLLKQKTKIDWLRDGDFNSSYFHSVVKGRTSRNRIKMVLNDVGNAHYGDNVTNMFVSHFEK
ncbi:hypothetical protein Tco_0255537, partial [Tanacetum coccineum]